MPLANAWVVVFSYWDWSLDWEDPPKSPVFDSKLGFGGDGDPNSPMWMDLHCVTDSPLKNLRPQWYGSRYDPHCLTRWFDEEWFGKYMNPAALEKLMASESYEQFFLALEMGPHDLIPMGVRGDMVAFTAPNGMSSTISYLAHFVCPWSRAFEEGQTGFVAQEFG